MFGPEKRELSPVLVDCSLEQVQRPCCNIITAMMTSLPFYAAGVYAITDQWKEDSKKGAGGLVHILDM